MRDQFRRKESLRFGNAGRAWGFALLGAVGCGGASSPTPRFAPDEMLTFSGQFVTVQGMPLAETRIDFRNLRTFGYFDHEAAVVDLVKNAVATTLMLAAWPFFWIHGLSPIDLSRYERRPSFFLSDVRTSATGNFEFRARADALVRDASGAMNITIVNGLPDGNDVRSPRPFGKFSFVVKQARTDLGTIRLCDLGGLQVTQDATDVTLAWQAPPTDSGGRSIARYVLNLAVDPGQTLLWSASVPGSQTSVTLPRAVFPPGMAVRAAVEAFGVDEDQRKISCLTPLSDVLLPEPPEAPPSRGVIADVPGVLFKVSSFTNGRFDDNVFLSAFDARELTLNLPQPTNLTGLAIHNLKHQPGSGFLDVSVSSDGVTWQDALSTEPRRFLAARFPAGPARDVRFVKFRFPASLIDVQEISLY